MDNLTQQLEELTQTPDYRLSPTEARIRRLLVAVYTIVEDLQIDNRDMHNKLEKMSSEISALLTKFEALKPSKTIKNKVE